MKELIGNFEAMRQKIWEEETLHHAKETKYLQYLEERNREPIEPGKVGLRFENVTFAYPDQGKPAVQDITFELKTEGEVLALLGPSGSGKSTILRLIAGFECPLQGTIMLGEQEVSGDRSFVAADKRGVGMFFQDYALFPHLRVFENIGFGLSHYNKKERQERIEEILEVVDLVGFKNHYPHQLSGGQQQRVALARTLAPHPRILLLDEPLSNLDPSLRDEVRKEVLRIINAFNISTILVTHDLHDVIQVADRVLQISDGRIVTSKSSI